MRLTAWTYLNPCVAKQWCQATLHTVWDFWLQEGSSTFGGHFFLCAWVCLSSCNRPTLVTGTSLHWFIQVNQAWEGHMDMVGIGATDLIPSWGSVCSPLPPVAALLNTLISTSMLGSCTHSTLWCIVTVHASSTCVCFTTMGPSLGLRGFKVKYFVFS